MTIVNRKKKQINVRVRPEVYAFLQSKAKLHGMSLYEFAEFTLSHYQVTSNAESEKSTQSLLE